MDRTDSVFAVGMGAFLVAVIGAAGGWGDAADWAQALVTIVAALVALTIYRRQRADALQDRDFALNRDQSIAMMQVAAGLRAWMRASVVGLQELNLHFDSNGHAGDDCVGIPRFDIDLEHVARMPVARAKIIYSILEQRERAVEIMASLHQVTDDNDVYEAYYGESAKLFRRTRKIYITLAKETGLHPYTSLTWELDTINNAAQQGKVRGWINLPHVRENAASSAEAARSSELANR